MWLPSLLTTLVLAAPLASAEAPALTSTADKETVSTTMAPLSPSVGQSFFSPKTEGDIAAMATFGDHELSPDLGDE